MVISRKYRGLIWVILVIIFCIFAVPYRGFVAEESSPKAHFVKVIRAIDGDTVEIEGGERVRYIGINTPELHHPRKPVEPFAKEAWRYNRGLVEGKMVYLVPDVRPRDRYGRLLAYAFLGDIFINARLVNDGYARVATFPPNVTYQELFLRLEHGAKEDNRGLWESRR